MKTNYLQNERYDKKGYLLERFRLFHLRDVQRDKVDYHYHEFYKLLFLVSGNGGYSVEGKRYQLKSGDLVLIGRHCVHRPEFENDMPYERIILYISPDFLTEHSASDCDLTRCFSGEYGHVLRPEGTSRQELFRLIHTLEQELKENRKGSSIMSNSILLQLIVEMMRNFRQEQIIKPSPVLPKNKRILEIVQYLDAHLTEDLTIDGLADMFYFSRFHMMRRFKEETGTTIHSYLSDRRLLLAKDYITQGLSPVDACFQCGFKNYGSFSRAYGKFFGSTPTGRKISSGAAEETFE